VLRTCFELEAAGWKGRERTAVVCVPAAWNFYLQQARQLAACEQLRVAILRFDGRPIAFEFGWEANGVRAVLKVGFDEAFGRFSPGQLLRYLLLEQLFAEGCTRAVDYMGPVTSATATWATNECAYGRLVCAFSGLRARAVVAGLRYAAPILRRIRRKARPEQVAARPNVEPLEAAEVPAGAAE
jgi:CelD/BcsL family acetyltransferase involved in cellulose biosynthesis